MLLISSAYFSNMLYEIYTFYMSDNVKGIVSRNILAYEEQITS